MRSAPIGLVAFLLLSTPAWATQDELHKLLANAGRIQDGLGRSAAVHGRTALVGAPGVRKNGSTFGAAYLFDTRTGLQLGSRLVAKDKSHQSWFGTEVDLGESIAIVGAYGYDDRGADSGAAYLFRKSGGQIAKLLPGDVQAGDYFGASVAIDGAPGADRVLAIVGAPRAWTSGIWAGAAYLFDAETGTQVAKLLPNDGRRWDVFGDRVDISGDRAIVGAVGSDARGPESGAAYVFDTRTGKQLWRLLGDDTTTGDRFGCAVAIDGTLAIVGAWGDANKGGTQAGAAYVFDVTTGQQVAKLLARDGAFADTFGWRVGISGTTAVVSAWQESSYGPLSSAVYLFDVSARDRNYNRQIRKLVPSDHGREKQFAYPSIHGRKVVVGAPGDDEDGFDAGAAYVFSTGVGVQDPREGSVRLLSNAGLLGFQASIRSTVLGRVGYALSISRR
jgi:hypothetical protein